MGVTSAYNDDLQKNVSQFIDGIIVPGVNNNKPLTLNDIEKLRDNTNGTSRADHEGDNIIENNSVALPKSQDVQKSAYVDGNGKVVIDAYAMNEAFKKDSSVTLKPGYHIGNYGISTDAEPGSVSSNKLSKEMSYKIDKYSEINYILKHNGVDSTGVEHPEIKQAMDDYNNNKSNEALGLDGGNEKENAKKIYELAEKAATGVVGSESEYNNHIIITKINEKVAVSDKGVSVPGNANYNAKIRDIEEHNKGVLNKNITVGDIHNASVNLDKGSAKDHGLYTKGTLQQILDKQAKGEPLTDWEKHYLSARGSTDIDNDKVKDGLSGGYNDQANDIWRNAADGLVDDNDLQNTKSETYDIGDYNTTKYMHLDRNYSGMGNMLYKFILSPYATFGIGGMPASYLATTDPPAWINAPASGNSAVRYPGLGTMYMNHYIRYGQYVSFRPCIPSYRQSFTNVMNAYKEEGLGAATSDVFFGAMSGQLADLQPKVFEYWTQVSRLCRTAIYLMGIENDLFQFETGSLTMGSIQAKATTKRGVSYDKINTYKFGKTFGDVWMSVGTAFANVIGNKSAFDVSTSTKFGNNLNDENTNYGTVAFLCDGPIQVTESLDNQTNNSAMAEVINKIGGGPSGDSLFKEVMNKMFNSNPINGSNSILNLLTGNYMIPKVWTGASYERSYEIKIKAIANDGTPASIFLGPIFTLIKVFCLAVPEATGGLLFTPWVCNVFSNAGINIDFGMITGLRISKEPITLNDAGMPTELDISIQVADLRPFLFQERPRWWSYTSKHSGSASNYLASLVGVNMTTISPVEKKKFREIISKMNYEETVSNMARNMQLGVALALGRGALMLRDIYYKAEDKIVGTQYLINGSLQATKDFFNGNK